MTYEERIVQKAEDEQQFGDITEIANEFADEVEEAFEGTGVAVVSLNIVNPSAP